VPLVKQRKEVGLAVTACGNQFTIDDAQSCWEVEHRHGNPGEAAGENAAIPAVEHGRDACFVKLHTVAVEFQFKQLAVAGRRR
jgi:hypothetical protein